MTDHHDLPPLTGPGSPESVFAALELAVRRRLPGRLHGDHHGLRLGSGSDPEEVVKYTPGEDDVRRIDWNVTARAAGEPHVWRPLAEHELETWVLVDATPSMEFGTVALEKRHLAAGATAAVALLTQGPGNRVGTVHLTGQGLRWTAPVPSRVAAHRALKGGSGITTGSTGSTSVGASAPRREAKPSPSDLAGAITALAGRHRRPGVRVVISDFVEPDGRTDRPFPWEKPLRRLAAVHETLVIEVVDPRELELPDVGAVTLVDPESGHRREIWTSDRKLRRAYAEAVAQHRAAVAAAVRSSRAGHVLLRTDRDWVRDLARHVVGPLRHGRARDAVRQPSAGGRP